MIKYDTYVVFDDSKSIEYLDLNGKVIGWEKGYTHIKVHKQKSKNKKDTKKIIEEIDKIKKYNKLKTLKNAIITT